MKEENIDQYDNISHTEDIEGNTNSSAFSSKEDAENAQIQELLERAEASTENIDEENRKIEEEKKVAEEFKLVVKENAREDERPTAHNFTLAKILGGDILNTKAIRNQIWLILLITLFTFIYVSNRYSCQKKQIQIAKLNKQLQDAKYRALALSSELTELSRESNVLDKLKNNKDSSLKISSQPPFLIKVEE